MKPLALALALCPAALPAHAADWSKAKTFTVTTTEYRFSPKNLVFMRDTPYRLHIENHGKEMHEFTAPAFFKAIEMRDTAPLNPDKTEIEVSPGTAKDLYFAAAQPGKYKLRCSDHDWAGMTGSITVK